MGHIYRKIKRPICIILAAIIIITSPIVSYKEVKAAEFAVPLSELLLSMFCASAGLGNQSDFSQRCEFFTRFCDAASTGSTISLDDYGDIDFSDASSIDNALQFGMNMNKYLLGGLSVVDAKHASTYTAIGKQLDKISYSQTGTSASASLSDSVSAFYNDYNGTSEALAEDVRDCFTVITGGGLFNDDVNDDAETKAERRRKFWRTFAALTSVCMIGGGSVALPLAALKECSESEYQDYSNAFDDAVGFSGTYSSYINSFDSDYDDSYCVLAVSSADGCISKTYYITSSEFVSENNIFGFYEVSAGERIVHLCFSNGLNNVSSLYAVKRSWNVDSNEFYNNSSDYSIVVDKAVSVSVPVFNSIDDAYSYFYNNGSDDLVQNWADDSAYINFKSATDSSNSVVGDAFSDSIADINDLNDLNVLAPKVLDAADSGAGTSDALLALLNALTLSDSDTDVGSGTETSGSSVNYSGILGKILLALNTIIAGLNGIPLKMVNSLASKFITAEDLISLVNGIPAAVADATAVAFEFPVVKPIVDAVTGIPAAIVEPLTDIFPNSIAVGEAILGFPAAVADAVKGIDITVPDITIPDIAIPDIVIPDIVIPDIAIPDIAIPDVNVTVNNDYASLLDIIYQAVSAVLTALFIPDEALATAKIGAIKEYFKFKDDIVDAVGLFIDNLKGITPSPYLKIPIGHSTSKYNYGTGDYFIVDASWYGQYKDFGDKIILAIAWALFLWRVFIKLPGIINGTEGSIMAANRSYERYSKQD